MNQLLVIDNLSIRTDAKGRFCLNDLHRAAGGEKRHGPSYWLANAQTKELVGELGGTGIPASPVATLNDGQNNGTYVAKELVYAYAMWISPAFHLKVIRAYDRMASNAQVGLAASPFRIPKSLPEALRLAADESERADRAECALAVAAPKAEALDRIATAEGSLCLRDAAKELQMQPKQFNLWMQANKWIYKRAGGSNFIGYQDRIQSGLLEHKANIVIDEAGNERLRDQVRVTAKGLTRLAALLEREVA